MKLLPVLPEFTAYFNRLEDPSRHERVISLVQWILTEFPQLEQRYAWNQPMLTDHGTFILSFSFAKPHFAIAPEGQTIDHFAEKIKQSGYSVSKKIFRIGWNQPIDYALLKAIISFNIKEKENCQTFWRK